MTTESYKNLLHKNAEMSREVAALTRERDKLQAVLVVIRDHPHCQYSITEETAGSYSIGVADGHRCAAAIAAAALATPATTEDQDEV